MNIDFSKIHYTNHDITFEWSDEPAVAVTGTVATEPQADNGRAAPAPIAIESPSAEVAMGKEMIQISFAGFDAAQAAECAVEFADYIRQAPGVEVYRLRENLKAQDLGSSVALVFAGVVGKVLVDAIRHYFKQKARNSQLELIEKQLQLEEMRREPLTRVTLRSGGEAAVGYVSPDLIPIIEQLIEKTKRR